MANSVLLVNRRRGGTLSTVVVAAVAAHPEVMVLVVNEGLDACSAELLAKFGDGELKLDEGLKGNEELCVGGSAVGGECTIGRSESCNRGAITGGGYHKVGDCFDHFVLIAVIG